MTNQKNGQKRKHEKMFFILKLQAILAVVGALLTTTLLLINSASGPKNYIPAVALSLISIPSVPFLKILSLLGIDYFKENSSIPLYAIVVFNAFSYLVIGTFLGLVLAIFKKLKKQTTL